MDTITGSPPMMLELIEKLVKTGLIQWGKSYTSRTPEVPQPQFAPLATWATL